MVFFVFLCIAFAVSLAPRVMAQARGEQSSSNQYTTIIRNTFEIIQRNFVEEVDQNQLFEGAMRGMLESLEDPNSSFLPESHMARLRDTTQGTFGGVGLFVTKPNRTDGSPNYLEVAAPIEGTPGWRAGLTTGDLIVKIDGESTAPLTSDEAVAMLRGHPGTEVKLNIRRGELIEFPVTLVRAIIEVPTVRYAMIGNFGYINVLTFTPRTAERVRDAIREFQGHNYQGIILDMRNNHGGLLDAAIAVSSIFLDSGPVVSIRSRTNNQVHNTRGRAIVPQNIPIVVLINRGSASASEIVAGALKDHGRAFLVGERTFGKGSVQQVYPLERAGFTLTVARYFTPSGANIDRIGIPPDREVRFPQITEADAVILNALLNSGKIADFIQNNPDAQAPEIEAFAVELNREYALGTFLLRRLIRNEQNRRTVAPLYDLDYDVQLQEAVRILEEGNFWNLIQNARTIQQLQEELQLEEQTALAS